MKLFARRLTISQLPEFVMMDMIRASILPSVGKPRLGRRLNKAMKFENDC